MRLCRRRRRTAVLLLLTVGALVVLTSHMAIHQGLIRPGSDVKQSLSSKAHRHESQVIFKDLVVAGHPVKTTPPVPQPRDETMEQQDTGIEPRNLSKLEGWKDSNITSQQFENTHWMTLHGGGRLGNSMFQYAALVGVSSYHGFKSTLQTSHSLRRVFKLTSPPSSSSRSRNKCKREKSPGIFDSTLLELTHDTNWTLIGYYQSWRYFGNISEKIRQEFTFRDAIIKEMLAEAPILANWTRVTIGVHVRRGDMASKYERERGYNVADLGFLKRSMNYFRKKYENPIFLVCSDSITWCKDNLKADDTMFMKGRREVDLATLAHCDHNIVTSGSFGWWGAWLAGGDVVYFNHFPREKTWLDRQYNKQDYYPNWWIGMD